jgi:phage baseplate assembly protein W
VIDELIGPRYPLSFHAGRLALSAGDNHLRDSIAQIIMTGRGEYLMKPDFGANVPQRVFDPVSLLGLLHTDIGDALKRWERRVELVDVRAGLAEGIGTFMLGAATTEAVESGVVAVHITFRVRGMDEVVNMSIMTQQR